ncbi:hypothetical protein [Pseudoduganella namucuonensis]|uniref:PH domain-containing protein n=1 Tax=Pseudoduganella namucuonensis TaxID=1035707 RepID=A0A1I7L2U7_9BURK|nr:hypothetical protein [Pseudoduganella namucuonensis]SFV03824.1 hypothetical protein SAMN05216552_102259 [Pseudoduganella namucuonensis]
MEEDNASRPAGHGTLLCVKSWTAYLNVLLMAVLLFGFALPLSFRHSELAAGAVMAVSAVLVGYRVLSIRSVQLYYDDVGVWLYSGILPWTRGVQGVKWRDMDEASFVQSFWSWLFRSYSIRIGHRYTKASEILLTRMANGKDAVARLNAHHQKLIRDNVIN